MISPDVVRGPWVPAFMFVPGAVSIYYNCFGLFSINIIYKKALGDLHSCFFLVRQAYIPAGGPCLASLLPLELALPLLCPAGPCSDVAGAARPPPVHTSGQDAWGGGAVSGPKTFFLPFPDLGPKLVPLFLHPQPQPSPSAGEGGGSCEQCSDSENHTSYSIQGP